MNHERHYTLEEANGLLGWVGEQLELLRSARERLNDEEVREALSEAVTQNGGGPAGRHVADAFLDLRAALTELQESEIVLRDLDRGLVDFPSLREEREVYLCWEEGEDEIGYWHDLEAGFAGRRPL